MKTSSLKHPVRKVPDFWGNAPIEVRVCESDRDLKATVAMSQRIGSLSLCHHMTPAQAREMADALVSAADFIDPVNDSLCGKVSSGVACTSPLGMGCPDCTVSLHDVGAPE